MTWTKLSDDFGDDCWTLSDAAVRLHVDGLVWSNRKLLDCQLPKDDLARVSRAAGAVDELVSVGWWTDAGEHYVIRHHAVYQRTRDQVLRQQEANRKNGRRGGLVGRERHPADTEPADESVSESLDESVSERDGTGLVWKGTTHLEEEQHARANEDHAGSCRECQRRRAFGSPPCPDHEDVA